MSTDDEKDAVQHVTEILHDAFNHGLRSLCVVRCPSAGVVDAARETLLREKTPFGWKSLPLAELSPPDLPGFLGFRGKAQGPAFLGYSLPIDYDGGFLPEFLRNLENNTESYLRKSTLCVLLLTLPEMRAITTAAPTFWTNRSGMVAWPASSDTSRFVPARFGGTLANQAFGSVASRASGGVSATASGDVSATASGGVSATASGGVSATISGNVQVQIEGNVASSPQAGPWSGAPLNEKGEVPSYVLESAAPAGRRWGGGLVMGDEELGTLIDDARRLLDSHRIELARQELSKAARKCREQGLELAEAECYVILGKAAEVRIDFSVAFDWYKLAMDTYERNLDHAGYSDCCGFIAYMHFMQGDIAGAERCVGWGLTRDQAQGDLLRVAASHRRLGVIAEIRKDLEEADLNYTKAGKIEKEIEDMYSYSRSLNHLARIARIQKDFDKAEKYLEESLDLKEELDDQPGLAAGYHEMGNLFLNGHRYDEARQSYEEALEIEVKRRDIPGIAVTQAQLGLCFRQLLAFPDSYEALAIARSLMRKLKSPNIVAVDAVIDDVYSMVAISEIKMIEERIEEFLREVLHTEG